MDPAGADREVNYSTSLAEVQDRGGHVLNLVVVTYHILVYMYDTDGATALGVQHNRVPVVAVTNPQLS